MNEVEDSKAKICKVNRRGDEMQKKKKEKKKPEPARAEVTTSRKELLFSFFLPAVTCDVTCEPSANRRCQKVLRDLSRVRIHVMVGLAG